MIISAVYTIFIFNLLGLLCFFIAKESPKGQFRRWDYNYLPGILTPRVLQSKESWIMAHRAMSPYFTLLSCYFSLLGVINLIFVFTEIESRGLILNVTFLFGILLFAILVFLGDRVVAKYEKQVGTNSAGLTK